MSTAEEDAIPGLSAIFDALISGFGALGLDQLLVDAIANGDQIIDGIVSLGLTTAPLIMMEFIGVSSVNSILCALGIADAPE